MLVNIISWIVLGAIAGYVAGMIMKTGTGSIVTNVIVGIVGAFLGGIIARAVGMGAEGFSIMGLIIAIVGAVVLLFILGMVQKGRSA